MDDRFYYYASSSPNLRECRNYYLEMFAQPDPIPTIRACLLVSAIEFRDVQRKLYKNKNNKNSSDSAKTRLLKDVISSFKQELTDVRERYFGTSPKTSFQQFEEAFVQVCNYGENHSNYWSSHLSQVFHALHHCFAHRKHQQHYMNLAWSILQYADRQGQADVCAHVELDLNRNNSQNTVLKWNDDPSSPFQIWLSQKPEDLNLWTILPFIYSPDKYLDFLKSHDIADEDTMSCIFNRNPEVKVEIERYELSQHTPSVPLLKRGHRL